MKFLGKYWKVILAALLVVAAVFVYFNKYKAEKVLYEFTAAQMEITNAAMERNIQENLKYADIQDKLDDAKAELEASRLDLYKVFPVEMKEEDQIMYVLYLETLFKEEIFFSFNQAADYVYLQDGSSLQVLELVVNYKTTYQGFKDMINYLATDSRVASIQEASIEYDPEKDVAEGAVKLWLYLLNTDKMEYVQPDVAIPEIGKDSIFG